MSTNAPKSTMLRTVPVSSMPGTRSLISITSLRSSGLGSSSRGSRPGFCSSLSISFSVGTPMPHSSAALSMPIFLSSSGSFDMSLPQSRSNDLAAL